MQRQLEQYFDCKVKMAEYKNKLQCLTDISWLYIHTAYPQEKRWLWKI